MSPESPAERPTRCSFPAAGGDPCGRPATIYEEQRGLMVCQGHAPRDRQIEGIRGAIARLRMLIAAGRYAVGRDQALTLEGLVAQFRDRLRWQEGLPPTGDG